MSRHASGARRSTKVVRGKNNLETRCALAGDFTLARRMAAEVRDLAQRYGHLHFVRFLDGASGITHPYVMGEWDLAVERANAFARAVEDVEYVDFSPTQELNAVLAHVKQQAAGS